MKIILGSQSGGRQLVLKEAGYNFEVMEPNIDEKAIRSNDFMELPLLLARAKAEKLLSDIKEDAVLITSDQVVICNNELREKPKDAKEATYFLSSYSQYPPKIVTAVVVTNTHTKKQVEGKDIVTVYFKDIPVEIIQKIVSEGKIMQTAGGFRVKDPLLAPYIQEVQGSIDSVMGLPLKLTQQLMEQV